MVLDSMEEILDAAETGNKAFWQVVLEADLEEREVTAEASFEKMRMTWRAMLESVEGYQGDRRSLSGLVGGDGQRMRDYAAAGIGAVIGCRASIAGASGGCQAEIGSASAMAAGALAALRGGDSRQIAHAAAMALKNLMGLVCDPIAGLVEVPCVKRNVIGAVNAVSCADMALAGITSRVPADEVIDCMGDVGRRLPAELRETALGGLAATPFGKSVKERMERGEL